MLERDGTVKLADLGLAKEVFGATDAADLAWRRYCRSFLSSGLFTLPGPIATILTKRAPMTIRILHNPRCSKSRATLALLQDQGIEPEITLYLDAPPDASELKSILGKLGLGARELMRKGESEYRELGLSDESLTEQQLIDAMVENPRLIERPIVLANSRAAIGRPPESVLAIL
jgi:arsenate reductase